MTLCHNQCRRTPNEASRQGGLALFLGDTMGLLFHVACAWVLETW